MSTQWPASATGAESSHELAGAHDEAEASTSRSKVPKVTKPACATCRGLKMRCIRTRPTLDAPCDRCQRLNKACKDPPYRKPGRAKGVKNAVNRTLEVVQSELKRLVDDGGSVAESQVLLSILDNGSSPQNPLSTILAKSPPRTIPNFAPIPSTSSSLPSTSSSLPPNDPPLPFSFSPDATHHTPPFTTHHRSPTETISNPLGLLAEASDEVRPSPVASGSVSDLPRPPEIGIGSSSEDSINESITQMLMGPMLDSRISALGLSLDLIQSGLMSCATNACQPQNEPDFATFFDQKPREPRRDIGPAYDPIDLAVLTESQAEEFFQSFWLRLHPFISVLDPIIHTPSYVRARSSFLYTAICSGGAQISPTSSADVTKRLILHSQKLARKIMESNLGSLEIGQAFLLWLPWRPPPDRHADDKLSAYINYALSMAEELGLNGAVTLSEADEKLILELALLDPDFRGRLTRNRERYWLRFFLWESATSVAAGKHSVFVQNSLVHDEKWYIHPLASDYDAETCALVRLRRYIISLTDDVRRRLADNSEESTDWMCPFVDSTLNAWRAKWQTCLAFESNSRNRSLYGELLCQHGRIYILSHGLARRSTLATSGPPGLVNDCFLAALEACHLAVKAFRSTQFYNGLPHSTVPMIAYTAIVAMRLFDCDVGVEGFFASQASILGLLGALADALIESGSTPSHRVGLAKLYGTHLKVIVRSRLLSVWKVYQDSLQTPSHLVAVQPGTVTPIYNNMDDIGGYGLNWESDWWTIGTPAEFGFPVGNDEVGRLLFELEDRLSGVMEF